MQLLSIVIPTHDRSDLLRQALWSIAPLVGRVHEVIVADDGSTDDTMAVCRQIRENSRLNIWVSRTETSHGAQVARNRGMSAATGKWIMFLDSDDVLNLAGATTLLDALEQDERLDFVYGQVRKTDSDLRLLAGLPPIGRPHLSIPSEVAGYHWCVMGAIYRRDFLERVGPWNESLTGSQDWEFQSRVKLARGAYQYVHTTVAFWRQHHGNRVGARGFRPDYVRSVMIAADEILKRARVVGFSDSRLELRLAKRLCLHALEWGANGYLVERRECLRQAADCLSSDAALAFTIEIAAAAPAGFDAWLWRAFSRH